MADKQEACGCTIEHAASSSDKGYIKESITYCPMHKAAPKMRDALEWALPFVEAATLDPNDQKLRDRFASELVQAEEALAAARGRG